MDPITQPRPVSPYSLRGVAQAAAGAYQGAVGATTDLIERAAAPFARPPGYTPAPASPAPAAAPVATTPAPALPTTPAPTVGGAIDAIQQRQQQLQNLADGGQVQRTNMRSGGMVPGHSPSPGADNIPINGTAGEYMLPVDTTQAVGKENLDALVDATHMPLRGPSKAVGKASKAAQKGTATAMMRNGGKVPGYANGGAVDDEEERLRAANLTDSKPMPAGPVRATMGGGGAVFGMYPQLAGGRRTTYATDAALRSGVQATGPSTFAPAEPVATSVQRGLPAGVQPSAAGGGRGVVNPEPAVNAPAVAAATAGAAPARRYVDPAGNEVQPPAATGPIVRSANTNVMPAGPSVDPATDAALAAARAGAAARGENLGPSAAAANLPAGAGASVMPDRQAERNAQFDREVALDRARRRGGRAEARELAFLSEQDRVAAVGREAASREAGATQRLQMSEAGATARNRENIAATDRREGPSNAVRNAAGQIDLEGKKQLQAAQTAFQKAVASGDDKAIKAAESSLRAAQGKWERPDTYAAVAVPGGVDPATGLATGSSVVLYDKTTGEVKQGMSPQQVKAGQRPAPAVGTTQGGFRFKGGNPADRNNWEKV